MGILDGVKRGADRMQNDLQMLNKKRNDRSARSKGFTNSDELNRVKRKTRAQAINDNNKRKRELEMKRIRREATMTRREKIARRAGQIERTSKKVRKEIDDFKRLSGATTRSKPNKNDP